mmetsp:Transcript_46018/g.121496  ORF Transcript_46018/g.121496 Transcript_46018/m.121496 type:complete len:266 (-) Transcript_46018:117-914(-)
MVDRASAAEVEVPRSAAAAAVELLPSQGDAGEAEGGLEPHGEEIPTHLTDLQLPQVDLAPINQASDVSAMQQQETMTRLERQLAKEVALLREEMSTARKQQEEAEGQREQRILELEARVLALEFGSQLRQAQLGDVVRARLGATYGGITVPQGACGTVVALAPGLGVSWHGFNSLSNAPVLPGQIDVLGAAWGSPPTTGLVGEDWLPRFLRAQAQWVELLSLWWHEEEEEEEDITPFWAVAKNNHNKNGAQEPEDVESVYDADWR